MPTTTMTDRQTNYFTPCACAQGNNGTTWNDCRTVETFSEYFLIYHALIRKFSMSGPSNSSNSLDLGEEVRFSESTSSRLPL